MMLSVDLSSLFSYSFFISVAEVLGKAALVVILALVLRQVIKKFVHRLFDSLGKKYQYSTKKIKTLNKTLHSVIGYVIFFIAAIMILGILGIPTASILAGAGVIGLAVGFGAQGLVSMS
jgi:small-conductance mechanosensitive channel